MLEWGDKLTCIGLLMTTFNPKQFPAKILLPISLIIVSLIVVNLWTPQEKEAPQLFVQQAIPQATILLEKPINSIYPRSNKNVREQAFNSNLFDSLLNLKNGKLEFTLATNFQNVDQKTWRFDLNKNAKFSNGQPVTAKDIQFSIENATLNNWPVADPLKQIVAVNIIDNDTIEIKTANSLPNFLVLISSVPIISQSQYVSKSPAEFAVGTAAYKLVSLDTKKDGEITMEQTIILEPNPHYLAKGGRVKKLTYRYLNTNEAQKLSLEDLKNNFDLIESNAVSSEVKTQLLTTNFSKTLLPQPSVSVLMLNVTNKGKEFVSTSTNPFSKQRVRKAINMALSPNQIISEAKIDGRTASQLATGLVFGFNPTVHRTATNQSEAVKILREEGYPNGFTLTITTTPEKKAEVESIARQLKQIGISVKINTIDAETEKTVLSDGKFAAYYTKWVNDFFDTTTTFTSGLATNGARNWTGFSEKEVDDKIAEINSSYDISNREKKLGEAMSLAMEGMVWIPVVTGANSVLVKDTFNLIPSYSAVVGTDITGK